MPRPAANSLSFSKLALDKLAHPDVGSVTYHDTVVKGLVLIVYPTGKTFHLYKLVDGRPMKPKIGQFPATTVEMARRAATSMLAQIAEGELPVRRRRQANLMVGEIWSRYIQEYARLHCTTWKETEKNFDRYFSDWATRTGSSVTRSEVQARVNQLGVERGHHTANRALDDLRAVINFGLKNGYFTGFNPCANVIRFKVRSRDRFLRPEEFKLFFAALQSETNLALRDYIYLSLFTGARQGNVLSMRWEQIDFTLGFWHIPITKNGESQTLPLTALALEILKDRYEHRKSDTWVFPSDGVKGHLVEPKAAWAKFLERAKLSDFRMHDLRRTLGSYMAMNNQSLQIIGKVLGHKSPTATQVYSRLAFDPLRQAMEAAQSAMVNSADVLPKRAGAKDKAKFARSRAGGR